MLNSYCTLRYLNFFSVEDLNLVKPQIRRHRAKKQSVHGAASDNEIVIRHHRKTGKDTYIGKTASDVKLRNKKLISKRFAHTSNSMNDLSVMPKNDNSSTEDLQKIDSIEERQQRPRQRSSSLDMGRGNLCQLLFVDSFIKRVMASEIGLLASKKIFKFLSLDYLNRESS